MGWLIGGREFWKEAEKNVLSKYLIGIYTALSLDAA